MKDKYNVSQGILITSVKRFSEAFDRGLSEGLIILEVDKSEIKNIEDFTSIVNQKSKGDVILLKVKNVQGVVRLVAVELE